MLTILRFIARLFRRRLWVRCGNGYKIIDPVMFVRNKKMSEDALYHSRLLRVHEYKIFADARAKRGKQNYMKIAPKTIYQIMVDFDKALVEVRHWQDQHQVAKDEIERLKAELEQARVRADELEQYAAEMQAVNDTNRTLAQDYKQMQNAYRHADSVGCAIEWLGENAERCELLLANILDRLTR